MTVKPSPRTFEMIVIGCSLGGMKALQQVLGALPAEFPIPIAVVQHRYRNSADGLPAFLNRHTALKVVDAEDKQWLKPGTVYLAPADYHMLVDGGEVSLSVEAAVSYARPSVDVLFESAADAYADRLIGIVLTGQNADGAEGSSQVKARGGFMVVQDPATAEAPSMPAAAIQATRIDRVLPLDRIGPFLVELCQFCKAEPAKGKRK